MIHAISYMIMRHDDNSMSAEFHLYSDSGRVAIVQAKIPEGEVIHFRLIESETIKSIPDLNNWVMNHVEVCLAILTFKQFAEVEVKHIGGKKYPKKTKINNEKYLNDSNHQIDVLDSRWFTETIRTEGFSVSGHFRLQPCGKNKDQRKLIYIKDYKKNGYHRKAKKDFSKKALDFMC
jgi:hypothetical protein